MSTSQRASLDPAEVVRRFDELQAKLVSQWRMIEKLAAEPYTAVVVPSVSLDMPVAGTVLQAYEERFLFLLLLLRQPRLQMVFVTSQPILPEIVDYYLALLPGVIPSHARARLTTLAVLDSSRRPLAEKVLDRPRMVERIRGCIADFDRAHLIPFNSTELERELAVRLGIPMYAADPKHAGLGSKSGSRRLFAELGIPHPLGYEDIREPGEIVPAIVALRIARPELAHAVLKLNESVAGLGNARVDLRDLPAPGGEAEVAAIDQRVQAMTFETGSMTVDAYMTALTTVGAIVEEELVADEVVSPSVQLRITPVGEVQLLSTHDQLLGGASGHSYEGCLFPADPAYAPTISALARQVGDRLQQAGVLGRFSVDFVVVRNGGGAWQPYAIELNLHKGGTTHPYLTLEFLTDGRYDAQTATFTTPDGRHKFYVASDHFESELYRALTPSDLFDWVVLKGLHYSHTTQTGVVFHMLSAVTEHGRLGLTAVGNSFEDARQLYDRAVVGLKLEALAALKPRKLG